MIAQTALLIGGLGAICGAALAAAARFLAVHEDPRIAEAEACLPGVNCGGCGYAGCADYARAIIADDAPVNLCTPGGEVTLASLAALTGRSAEKTERKVAYVRCGGSATLAPRKSIYNGLADCAAAHAVGGGDKACSYGCLGYGSCARVCPVDAIAVADGLAVVHPDLCIGCGACVKACPRDLITMVAASRTIHVRCSSKDKGPVVKKVCKVGCIGCRICSKLAADNAITMDGFLAVVDYAKPLVNPELPGKCPGKCIVDTAIAEEGRTT